MWQYRIVVVMATTLGGGAAARFSDSARLVVGPPRIGAGPAGAGPGPAGAGRGPAGGTQVHHRDARGHHLGGAVRAGAVGARRLTDDLGEPRAERAERGTAHRHAGVG